MEKGEAYLAFQLWGVRQTRTSDLNHDNFAPPMRVIPQEDLKGFQFLNDALDDIEFVPCDDDFFAFVQRAEGSQFRCNARSKAI